jgi:hypothetical protein
MSEMSLEELVSSILLFDIEKCDLSLEKFKVEILSRFADLAAKVKELELENEVLREQNFAMNKNAIKNKRQIADLQQKLENAKCCGNCSMKNWGKKLDAENGKCCPNWITRKPHKICGHYQPDQLTRIEREV